MNHFDLYESFQFHLPGGNPYVQALNQFHVFGATQICSGCTVANCLLMCTLDAICQGVDYDSRTTSCWRHTAATVCGIPVAKVFCSHYKKMNCRKYEYTNEAILCHKTILSRIPNGWYSMSIKTRDNIISMYVMPSVNSASIMISVH